MDQRQPLSLEICIDIYMWIAIIKKAQPNEPKRQKNTIQYERRQQQQQ